MYMNNAIKYLSLAAAAVAVASVASSCSREEDDIWSQSAAERLEAAKSEYHKILCSAPNGWEMYYFADGDEQGYNFLMKFASDSVVVAARNHNTGNAYQQESSAFEVIADDGPVLTFNTYNSLLHIYADPQPDHDVESDGVGSGGDYEFKMMTVTDTMIYMRGKKTGREIYMYPLDGNTDWEQYFVDVEAMRDSMFNESIPTLWLQLADGVRYSITDAASQVMHLVPEGGDAITQTSTISYVLTPRGFRWITDFPGDTVTTTPAREFVWNAEGTYLVSTDFGGEDCAAGATIKAPALTDLFMESEPVWSIDVNSLGGNIAVQYQNLVDGFAAATNAGRPLNWVVSGMSLLYDAANKYAALGISLKGSRSQGYIHYVRVADGDAGMKFDFNDSSLDGVIFTGSASQNGRTFVQLVPELTEFCDYLSSMDFTMLAVGGNEVNPHRIRFENSSNSNDYFYVELQ